MSNASNILVEVAGLKKYFSGGSGREVIRAVDDVSFSIEKGETFGLVGESGCGKSTTGRCVLGLIEPTAGRIRLDGHELGSLSRNQLRAFRRNMQIIFQDPYSSLNPRMKAGEIVAEPLVIHKIGTKAERRDRTAELLRLVGLDPDQARRYPHEFSGGQRQRIGIARALALNPEFIVCDEPVSALDVSVQAQIVNLLQDLQEQLGLTYLFISHGLAVVQHISTRVGIMYLGKLVELAPTDEIFDNPLHPYTRALLSAIPVPDPDAPSHKVRLGGEVPTAANPPSGCRFHTRCGMAEAACAIDEQELVEVSPGHLVACSVVAPPVKK